MKVQCDLCKEIVVADFAVVGDGSIELSCQSCRGRFVAPATRHRRVTGEQVVHGENQRARRATMPKSDEPSMTCPKCGDTQRPGPACRTCGLLAERMADFSQEDSAEVPASVAAMWTEVQASWRDPEVHERFAQAVAAADGYTWAARRYREVLRLRVTDTIAAEQIARLARMAEATLLASAAARTRAPASSNRGVVIVTMLVLLAVGVAVAYHLMSRGGGVGIGAPPPPPMAPVRPPPPTPASPAPAPASPAPAPAASGAQVQPAAR